MKPNRTIRIILRYKIMKRIIYLFFSAAAIGLFCVSPAFAAEATDDILSAFRKYKELRRRFHLSLKYLSENIWSGLISRSLISPVIHRSHIISGGKYSATKYPYPLRRIFRSSWPPE